VRATSNNKTFMASSIVYTSFLVLFYAVGIGMLAFGIKEIRCGLAARRWPVVGAQLEQCVVGRPHWHSNHNVCRVSVRYTYVVAGTTHAGDTLVSGYAGSGNRRAHEALCERLTGMAPFVVRYCPDRPDISTIFAIQPVWTFRLFAFSVIWLLHTTLMTAFMLFVSGTGGRIAAWFASS
jgi:hypothetical protein